ncbi:hypothetical protein BP5796_12263 [Coleophoma crateriformis]|uniref:Uncharacterized protein n=1 Tax=Coleophoma crateriformis TaxID=565419 RepID=A0A3D8Q918_9HELO|nr:hypothetical protein BP5796_12263 [Coleophoma crateriformis]
MWLINTDTFELEEFANHPKKQYAILSHRWEENEATFESWAAQKGRQKKGYRKIMKFVHKAAERGFKYAWADTCCMNKKSSAELSEAINSMFKYYQDAAECYVYLSDLPPSNPSKDGSDIQSADETAILSEEARTSCFLKSKWFTRGWTLQELIAPNTVWFFDSDWQFYGEKRSLSSRIECATKIPESILDGSQHIRDCSIACRMSWAANRQTRRIEDLAYCLLGIFGIHMPLLYGEGETAFIRLQEEICKKTTDMSLFAWKTIQADELYSGLFARSPLNFKGLAAVARFGSALQTDFDDEIAVTNRGVRFDHMPLYISTQYGMLLDLNCWAKTHEETGTDLFLCLCRTQEGWVRCRANKIVFLDHHARADLKSLEMPRIFIRRTIDPGNLRSSDLFKGSIRFEFSPGISLISAEPSHLWDVCMQGFVPNRYLHGIVHISAKVGEYKPEEFIVLCGISHLDKVEFKIPDWRQAYRSRALGQTDPDFKEIRDLVRKKQLHTTEGYHKSQYYLRKYASGSCWNDDESCFTNDIATGIRHRISVRGQVVSECGEDREDPWDMVKFHVSSEQIQTTKEFEWGF